jgi:hypothetical protein
MRIREELNLRLQNGAMGPEVLPWLNQLPETRAVLSKFFGGLEVSQQNLSDWRQGGYQEWLRLQERNLRFRQIAEEGTNLKRRQGHCDVFEDFARMSMAELAVDLDELDSLEGETRWKRLQGITREVARLQHEYIRSREADLKYYKFKYEVKGEVSFGKTEREEDEIQAPSSKFQAPEKDQGPSSNSENGEESNVQGPKSKVENGANKVEQGVSKVALVRDRRVIYYRHCGYGCICKTCHSDDGPYPYAEVVRDLKEAKEKSNDHFTRGNLRINVVRTWCDCPCDCERSKVGAANRLRNENGFTEENKGNEEEGLNAENSKMQSVDSS